ncbi:MAG: ExbD/TolR family protein [Candidatus Thermochlorobacter sp.]
MAKIKKAKRTGVKQDMTPMVDVAFLLLTFFMLTTQFRPPELTPVNLPNATAERKLPDRDIMTVTVGAEGDVYLGVDAQPTRDRIFNNYIAKRLGEAGMGAAAVEDSARKFRLAEGFYVGDGSDMERLANNLETMVIQARLAEPRLRPVIKADVTSDYQYIKLVMDTFKKTNMPTFNLITSLEALPKSQN